MIKYERIEGNMPQDVKCITDDAQAEMDSLTSAFAESDAEEMVTFLNIEACKVNDYGLFEFIIPGDEVGEVAELFWDADNGELDNLTDKWNQEALRAAQEAE